MAGHAWRRQCILGWIGKAGKPKGGAVSSDSRTVLNLGVLTNEQSAEMQRQAGRLCADLTHFLDRVNDLGAGSFPSS